jgi:DNA-binding XRE family transcriptional regulator
VSYGNALSGLRNAVRTFRIESGMSRGGLAKAAGIAVGALNTMDDPDWSPRYATLQALARFMDRESTAAPGAPVSCARAELRRHTVGVCRWAIDNAIVIERVFEPEAVNSIAPEMVEAMCAVVASADTSPRAIVSAARCALPDGATHLINISPRAVNEFTVTSWDKSTGYNGGADYSGVPFTHLFCDDAYKTHCEDAYAAAASRRPRFSFVQRVGADGTRRQFLRRLIVLPSSTNGPHVLAITLLKKGQAAKAFVADIVTA